MEELTTLKIEQLLDQNKYKEIKQLFEDYHEIDIADACEPIEDRKKLITIFRVVNSEHTSEFFAYLSPDTQEELIKLMSDKDIVTLLEDASTDDIVNCLEDLPANVAKKVLQNCTKEDRQIINKLLNYKEDSAGSIMTTEFIEFNNTMKVSEAIARIREIGPDAETIYTIFVRDEKRKFLGTVNLDDLIFAKPTQRLDSILNPSITTVDVNTDQEDVAEICRRYDLNAVPVLNTGKRLIGIITVDDIVDVIQEEANEDISLQAGVSPLETSYLETPVFKMAMKCIPWLMFLLVIDVFSSMVLSKFQSVLSTFAILAAFTPTIMDAGGNAGSQTSALMVRAIALNQFKKKEGFKVIWKEMRISGIVALLTSAFGIIWFMIEMYIGLVTYPVDPISYTAGQLFETRLAISLLVGLTLFITIIIAKFVGCVLPLLVNSLKKDPALVCGPFITSLVDVSSLLIYFGVFELLKNVFNIVT